MARLSVVSGAAGALGRAVCERLLSRGDRVLAVASPRADLGLLRRELPKVEWEAADLTEPDQVAALFQRIDQRGDGIEWLANLAGGYRPGRVLETEAEDLAALLRMNFETCWLCCQAGAGRIAAGGGGGIVNVAARQALEGGSGSAAYAVSKAAVLRLSQVLALELGPERVRVNVLLPTLIDTPANRTARSAEAMRRATSPDAVAEVLAWLLSPAAEALTGTSLVV